MKLVYRQFLRLAGTLAALPALAGIASAQPYPTKPITMIVGYPAGGPTDALARIMAEGMRASLGQSVVIENIGAAGGTVGVGRVARATADGYTISFGNVGDHVISGAVYALPYDVLNDFEPVSLVSSHPLMIVANKTMPAADLQQFIAWLKGNSDKASQGTAGVGSIQHLAGILLQRDTGTRFQFVPYRGSGPAMQDLLSGQIDFLIDPAPNSLPQVRAGTIKAYAVTAKSRLAAKPDIPTAHEAGVPGYSVGSWHALWVPKKTSKSIITRLNAAVMNALDNPAVRQRLVDLGQQIFPRDQQTPEALSALQEAENKKWWPIIKAASIRAE